MKSDHINNKRRQSLNSPQGTHPIGHNSRDFGLILRLRTGPFAKCTVSQPKLQHTAPCDTRSGWHGPERMTMWFPRWLSTVVFHGFHLAGSVSFIHHNRACPKVIQRKIEKAWPHVGLSVVRLLFAAHPMTRAANDSPDVVGSMRSSRGWMASFSKKHGHESWPGHKRPCGYKRPNETALLPSEVCSVCSLHRPGKVSMWRATYTPTPTHQRSKDDPLSRRVPQ